MRAINRVIPLVVGTICLPTDSTKTHGGVRTMEKETMLVVPLSDLVSYSAPWCLWKRMRAKAEVLYSTSRESVPAKILVFRVFRSESYRRKTFGGRP